MLPDATRFYIAGQWVAPHGLERKLVVDPATTLAVGDVAMGDEVDANLAVEAAHAAFPAWSRTSVADRLTILERIVTALVARNDEMAEAITAEMGAPRGLSRSAQAPLGRQHFEEIVRVLQTAPSS